MSKKIYNLYHNNKFSRKIIVHKLNILKLNLLVVKLNKKMLNY